jgi:hypothetical protein
MEGAKVNIAEAAEILGMSAQGLRIALQRGKFSYFGEAWKNDEKWTYYINRNRLEEYAGIKKRNEKFIERDIR